MRGVFDLACSDELLLLIGKDVVHVVAADEGGGSEGHVELFTSAIIVAEGLAAALRDADGHERCHEGWVEVVERSVDVPAVEARVVEVLGLGDGVLVEGLVVGVCEFDVLEAFVGGDEAVADDLDFWTAGDGLEIGVED